MPPSVHRGRGSATCADLSAVPQNGRFLSPQTFPERRRRQVADIPGSIRSRRGHRTGFSAETSFQVADGRKRVTRRPLARRTVEGGRKCRLARDQVREKSRYRRKRVRASARRGETRGCAPLRSAPSPGPIGREGAHTVLSITRSADERSPIVAEQQVESRFPRAAARRRRGSTRRAYAAAGDFDARRRKDRDVRAASRHVVCSEVAPQPACCSVYLTSGVVWEGDFEDLDKREKERESIKRRDRTCLPATEPVIGTVRSEDYEDVRIPLRCGSPSVADTSTRVCTRTVIEERCRAFTGAESPSRTFLRLAGRSSMGSRARRDSGERKAVCGKARDRYGVPVSSHRAIAPV